VPARYIEACSRYTDTFVDSTHAPIRSRTATWVPRPNFDRERAPVQHNRLGAHAGWLCREMRNRCTRTCTYDPRPCPPRTGLDTCASRYHVRTYPYPIHDSYAHPFAATMPVAMDKPQPQSKLSDPMPCHASCTMQAFAFRRIIGRCRPIVPERMSTTALSPEPWSVHELVHALAACHLPHAQDTNQHCTLLKLHNGGLRNCTWHRRVVCFRDQQATQVQPRPHAQGDYSLFLHQPYKLCADPALLRFLQLPKPHLDDRCPWPGEANRVPLRLSTPKQIWSDGVCP
jgi:hypothetical protein